MSRPGEVRVFGAGELTVSRDAVLWLAQLAQDGRQRLRLGGRVDPDIERWTEAVLEGARRTLTSGRCSDDGRSEVPTGGGSGQMRMLDPVGSTEAAAILSRGTREFTRLCGTGALSTARKVSGSWFAERSELLARAERTA